MGDVIDFQAFKTRKQAKRETKIIQFPGPVQTQELDLREWTLWSQEKDSAEAAQAEHIRFLAQEYRL